MFTVFRLCEMGPFLGDHSLLNSRAVSCLDKGVFFLFPVNNFVEKILYCNNVGVSYYVNIYILSGIRYFKRYLFLQWSFNIPQLLAPKRRELLCFGSGLDNHIYF